MTQIDKQTKNQSKSGLLKSIEHIFFKMKNIKSNVSDNVEILAQQQQANKLLDAELMNLYFAMIDNGYTPTAVQHERVALQVNSLIDYADKSSNLHQLNNICKSGYHFSHETAYNLIANKAFQEIFFSLELFNPESALKDILLNREKIISPESSNIITSLREVLFTESFGQYIADKWCSLLHTNIKAPGNRFYMDLPFVTDKSTFSLQNLLNVPTFMNYMPSLIIPYISMDKFINFVAEFKEKKIDIKWYVDRRINTQLGNIMESSFIEDTENLFNLILNDKYSQDIKNLLNKTKGVFSERYIEETAAKTTQTLAHNYKVHNLPTDTQKLLKEIQGIYSNFNHHKDSLNEDQAFLVNNLFEKRIPEVLQKYFSIDQEYRVTLTNSEGKNAKDLMNESLTNFKNKLSDILENINENKLSELNVTKRYSQKI